MYLKESYHLQGRYKKESDLLSFLYVDLQVQFSSVQFRLDIPPLFMEHLQMS